MNRSRNAFTLIEFLVAAAVVAVLTGLLWFAVTKVHASTARARGTSVHEQPVLVRHDEARHDAN